MRSAVQHKYPDVQFILDALARSLVVLTAEGDLLLGRWSLRVVQNGQMGNGESDRLSLAKDQFSPIFFCVLEEAQQRTLQENLVTNKQRVSSTLDDFSEECVPETHSLTASSSWR